MPTRFIVDFFFLNNKSVFGSSSPEAFKALKQLADLVDRASLELETDGAPHWFMSTSGYVFFPGISRRNPGCVCRTPQLRLGQRDLLQASHQFLTSKAWVSAR